MDVAVMSAAEKARARAVGLPEPLTVVDVDQVEIGQVAVASFADDIATALVDVRGKLDATTGERTPLFETDAVELLDRDFPAARWLVTGLVTRGGITMIGAEPKAAKTWLGTEIALAVATGSKVCGEFFAEYGRVAYFYAEDMDVQVRNRVRALLAGVPDRRLMSGRLFLQPRGTFIDILDDNNLAWLVASCRKLGTVDLLVLDPLRDIHGGEEDKSDSMRNVMRRLRVLAEILGCTVAVVHHAPKQTKDNAKRRPGQNLRGSGAIHGSVDSGLYLEDSDGDGTNVFTNTVTSQVKGARSAGRFHIELAVTDDEQGEAIEARWTYTREVGKASKSTNMAAIADADELAVIAFVREAGPMSRTELKTSKDLRIASVGQKRRVSIADRLVGSHVLKLLPGGQLVDVCYGQHTGNLSV